MEDRIDADVLKLLNVFADALAARLLSRIGGHAANAPLVYTTHKRGPHVPGKTRAWMLRHVKTMLGSRKVGRDWTIAAADYEAWETAQDTSRVRSRVPSSAAVAGAQDDVAFADACIAAAGYRVPRSA
jgi:hypothetical protein